MKTCTNCGTQNENDANFCIECNTPFRSRDTVGSIGTALPEGMMPKEERRLLLEPGDVFAGRYEIVDQIGQGGMGVVYKSLEKLGSSVERGIALKLIRSELLVNEAAVDKLVHEGVLTQRIRHKNVVAVHNVGVFEGQPFVAMEFVEGLSMREWLRRKFNFRDDEGLKLDIPFPVAAQIVRELLAGLGAAHELGIVHRDLKPENIIFTGEPTAESAPLQILDFGIARAPGPAMSTASSAMGTFEYMAQEQKTNPAGVEPAADLYSLSIIFYEMLMEVLPKNEGRDLAGTRGDVPDGVAALISKGLANAPRGRPQSVAEYRAALNDAIGMPVERKLGPVTPERIRREDIDKGKDIPPPPEPPTIPRKWLIGGGIGAIAFLFMQMIGCDTDGPGGNVDPEVFSSSTTTTSSSSFGGDDPPPPEPPEGPDFSYLGGTWYNDDGEPETVGVAADGSFRIESSDDMGAPLTIRGNIAEQTFWLENGNGAFPAPVKWDGACHLNFFDPATNQMAGQFHLSHPPDVKECPAKFNR